jgi:hypothetical protein
MAKKTSTVAIVVGILQLIFGVLGICIGVVAVSGLQEQMAALQAQNPGVQKQPFNQAQLQDFIEKKTGNYRAIMKAQGIGTLILAFMMIASGIGLLMTQSWGRILALIYAGLSILFTVAAVLYTFAVLVPAVNEFAAGIERQGDQMARSMAMGVRIGIIGGGVINGLLILYPILVLILLLQPGVAAVFQGKSRVEEPEDYDDRYPRD